MFFNSSVFALSAIVPPGERAKIASGFLFQADEETYLVTVGHAANTLHDQYAEWADWAQTITFHDQQRRPLGQVDLFVADDKGNRTPVFKYARVPNHEPDRIFDLIMVPLPAGDPLISTVGEFRAFAPVSIRADEPVAIVGCHDWPRVNTKDYFVRGADASGIVLYVEPASEDGESGGPMLSLSGDLFGVNFGAGNHEASDKGLVLNASLLQVLLSASEGYWEGLPRPDRPGD